MIGLVVTMTTTQALIVGGAFIVVGMLMQLFISLEVDDRRDVREQEAEADRDAILDVVAPRIPQQRQGGAR